MMPEGTTELAGALVRTSAYLFTPETRNALDEVNRQAREARRDEENAQSDEARAEPLARGEKAGLELLEILEASNVAINLSLMGDKPMPKQLGPAGLAGDAGSILLRIVTGNSETRCTVADVDISTSHGPVEIDVTPSGITWALVRIRRAPVGHTMLRLKFRDDAGWHVTLPFAITSPEHGQFKLAVLSDDTGDPVPAMVRLTKAEDGQAHRPSNAVEFAPLWDGIGSSDQRNAGLPGKLRGQYWCIPGPFNMSLPPGQWEVIVRRGLEHETVFDTFKIETGTALEKTYRPERWVNMPKRGWFSGDDHVHGQILSDADAARLIAWIQAEDIHLANVVKMGDIHKTYFEQRGFGKTYQVRNGDYILSPGQECPRTDELGHTLAMNITSMVRDTDKYFLYDWVFDQVHAQGGLSGYAHVNRELFHVHRDMSMNIPKGKIDFAELLQFGNMRTDLYYEFLNTGFKLTAASGSDVPWGGTIGEGRMFAYIGSKRFSADAWFDAVQKGRTFVSNGPMLEFKVGKALPGDTITLTENQPLKVRARAWGDARRVLPAKLELMKHGEVIATVEASEGENALSLDLELDGENGFWMAVRAEGTDGSKAHTTPIYVVREPLRFWKFNQVEDLIARRFNSLAEVEQIIAEAVAQDARGEVDDNQTIKQLALQGPQLLERVQNAKQFYEDLYLTFRKEQTLRLH
jgi:hypothetical protein